MLNNAIRFTDRICRRWLREKSEKRKSRSRGKDLEKGAGAERDWENRAENGYERFIAGGA